ncbi:uncharacterized protein LOC142786851 [Rhipicephalus microplus]|uniref:uncharacterized protein LOC142786851 n=1 Tax=Rhipicephalus microplus TaxID=6941 RepID=UPI003F6ADF51
MTSLPAQYLSGWCCNSFFSGHGGTHPDSMLHISRFCLLQAYLASLLVLQQSLQVASCSTSVWWLPLHSRGYQPPYSQHGKNRNSDASIVAPTICARPFSTMTSLPAQDLSGWCCNSFFSGHGGTHPDSKLLIPRFCLLQPHPDGRGPPTSPALRPEVEVLPGPGFPLQLPLVHPDPTMDHAPRRNDVRLDVNGAD